MGGTESDQTVTEEGEEEKPEVSPADQAAAVIEKINIIGPVTTESGPAIKDARSSYEALSDEVKALVTNIQTLSDAEAAYANIEAASGQQESAAVAADPAALQQSADQVAAQINAIGPVTSESGPAIAAAEAAYNSLSEEARALVTNAGDLAAKRAEFDAMQVQ